MHLKLILAFTTALLCQVSWAARGTSCPCGWSNKGRIVGGKETKKNEFPWMASLYHVSGKYSVCGASVITPFHALTAAHCIHGNKPAEFNLVVGAHKITDSRDGKKVPIEVFVVHSEYTKRGYISDDIGMIVTKNPIPMGPNVGPVCLPSTTIELTNQKITAIGWGQQSFGKSPSPVLKSADLTVVSYDSCKKYWPLMFPKSQVCTVDAGKSTCHGDSGGPLVWLDPETQRFTLVALTSFGKECVTPPPAVNTEIAAYIPWIKRVIQDFKPQPICTKV